MTRLANILITVCLISVLSSLTVADSSKNPRVEIKIDDLIVSRYDSTIVMPVYFFNPFDTVAGIELHVRLEDNRHITFALDNIKEEGLEEAVDTVGTLISGWEWIGTNLDEDNYYDFKLAAMADWPDGTITPPLMPQEGGVLVNLVLRIDEVFPFTIDTKVKVIIETEKTGIADYSGNTIGIVTTIEKQCEKYIGDSCLSWKTARVGSLDTTVVKFNHGSISIIDSLSVNGE